MRVRSDDARRRRKRTVVTYRQCATGREQHRVTQTVRVRLLFLFDTRRDGISGARPGEWAVRGARSSDGRAPKQEDGDVSKRPRTAKRGRVASPSAGRPPARPADLVQARPHHARADARDHHRRRQRPGRPHQRSQQRRARPDLVRAVPGRRRSRRPAAERARLRGHRQDHTGQRRRRTERPRTPTRPSGADVDAAKQPYAQQRRRARQRAGQGRRSCSRGSTATSRTCPRRGASRTTRS